MDLSDKRIIDSYLYNKKDVLKALNTVESGLSKDEALIRLKTYGENAIKTKKRVSPLKIFCYQFKDVMIYLLIIATIISFLINELIDGAVILTILIINALLGFIQEYKAEKAMEALETLAAPKAVVLREGQEFEIWSRELVPGDIVMLNTGDRVPANLRIIDSLNLEVDQSHLTGESVPISKDSRVISNNIGLADRNNIAYMGSLVNNGRGVGVIVATAYNTEVGRIAETVQEQHRESTPLQKEINSLGKWLSIVVIASSTMLFIIGLLFNHDITEMFLTSVSLAVSAVPEGLPAVITVTLAIGMQRMGRRNAVVRKLSAVQTLGNVTVICTDKTGTLTKNEMTITNLFDGVNEYRVTGVGYSPEGSILLNNSKVDLRSNPNIEKLIITGALCNGSFYGKDNGSWNIVGDPTEGSLLVLLSKAGKSVDELKKGRDDIAELSFNSERKRMSVVYKRDNFTEVFTKGAPEVIINLCTSIMINNKKRKLTSAIRKDILEKNKQWALRAQRVLALAYKEFPNGLKKLSDDYYESELIFLGLAGMIDPPRDEVKDSIKLCKKAGIDIRMVTGDYVLTAKAIAEELGLFNKGDIAVSGDELDNLSDDDFRKTVAYAKIFARVSPEHKLRIVTELKRIGAIVAVTGDGVNDAPALKTAHIGVAMGIKGTDVSKEASEMVLTDDNFATIVNAVEEGRGIFDNIKKFIKFLLSANFSTIFVVTFAVLTFLPLPFLPTHILWMNLITDGIPALALSVDPKSKDLMDKKPRNPKKSLIREIALFIIIAGIVSAVSSISLFLISLNFEGYFINPAPLALSKARTISISSAILFELFFVFNCRDDSKSFFSKSFKDNFLSNKKLTLAVMASIVLQMAFIYLPAFNIMFKTTPLNFLELALVFIFASTGLLIFPKYFNKELKLFSRG